MSFINDSINFVKENAADFAIYVATQETGILIGLGLLFWASSYLPKKVRMHVLTGGISIALYQMGKNYYFRQQYKEAELERERLKQEKDDLEKQGKELLLELSTLKERSKTLDKEIDDLKSEKERLRAEDNFDPNEFDERIEALRKESNDLDATINALPVITKRIGETTHQLNSAVQ